MRRVSNAWMAGFQSASTRRCHRSASAAISVAPVSSPIAAHSSASALASPYMTDWINVRQPEPDIDCSCPSLPGSFHRQSCSLLNSLAPWLLGSAPVAYCANCALYAGTTSFSRAVSPVSRKLRLSAVANQ